MAEAGKTGYSPFTAPMVACFPTSSSLLNASKRLCSLLVDVAPSTRYSTVVPSALAILTALSAWGRLPDHFNVLKFIHN
jgi:hypothetical protein